MSISCRNNIKIDQVHWVKGVILHIRVHAIDHYSGIGMDGINFRNYLF